MKRKERKKRECKLEGQKRKVIKREGKRQRNRYGESITERI